MKVLSTFTRLAVVLLFLAVCLAPGTILAQEKTEILIGAPISITGPNAMNGIEQEWAYKQAIYDYHKAHSCSIPFMALGPVREMGAPMRISVFSCARVVPGAVRYSARNRRMTADLVKIDSTFILIPSFQT